MRDREKTLIVPRLLGADELTNYLSLGRNRAVDLALNAKAQIRVGKRTLYDRVILDSYIDNMQHEGAN